MQRFQSKSALLTLLVVGFVSLFAVGCGDDREDFVFTGNQNAPNTGTLVFQFDQQQVQQAVGEVPGATETLRFDFFTGNPPVLSNFLFTETREYDDEVTFTGVPTSVQVVVITAFDENNQPLVAFTQPVTVVAGDTVVVDLNEAEAVTLDAITVTPDPVSLGEGQTKQLVVNASFDNGSVADVTSLVDDYAFVELNGVDIEPTMSTSAATVTEDGLLTFVEPGWTAKLRVSYTVLGETHTDVVTVNTYELSTALTGPDDNNIGPGESYDDGYTVEVVGSEGGEDISESTGFSYSLAPGAPDDVSVNATTGVVTHESGANGVNQNVTVIVRWVAPASSDKAGLILEDEVLFNITHD